MNRTNKLILPLVGFLVLTLSSCGGGGSDSPTGGDENDPDNVVLGPVNISGTLSYDYIPHFENSSGLDYNNTETRPARGVDIAVFDANDVQLSSTSTSETGEYTFEVDANTLVRIQATARIAKAGIPSWDVQVTDNTNGYNLYGLTGSLINSGATDSVRDLHASSGWGTDDYDNLRASAPYAILDTLYETIQKFVSVDDQVVFPQLSVNWSVNNNSLSGADRESGDIGTSFYSDGEIFILGQADLDTDEYDSHVIVHEWGHYFEDQLSRSDSIGGSHSLTQRLDLRLAFGEGWGNALSAMILDDPIYKDSLGQNQFSGFSINIDQNVYTNEGWFNEGSVQSILYDLYDEEDDSADNISLGLKPIYDVLVSDNYTENSYLTSIFSFISELSNQEGSQVNQIEDLTLAQNINGSGNDGFNETNDGGLDQVLPVFKTVTSNGGVIELCSSDSNGTFNKLGVRDFAFLVIDNLDIYSISVSKKGVSATADPDFVIWQSGDFVAISQSAEINEENWSGALGAGEYVIEFYDYNILTGNSAFNQSACYDFSITD